MPPTLISIPLGPNDDGRRLDRVARKVLRHLPLSRVYSAIRAGEIRLNGRRTGGDTRVAAGDVLGVREHLARGFALPPGRRRRAGEVPELSAPAGGVRTLSQRIVTATSDIVVILKQRGELVHGPDSLASLVERYLEGSLASGVSFTPGPVHRLDRNTTGLVVFSASLNGARAMSAALRSRQVRKLYAAVVSGRLAADQRWDSMLERDRPERRTHSRPIETGAAGKRALTIVAPIATSSSVTLVVAEIVTGRTHQIRSQAAANGTPLLGDRKYGGPPWPGGYILHAGALTLSGAIDIDAPRHIWVPLPSSAERRVSGLFGADAVQQLYAVLSNPAFEE